jgi:hypothetical protein
MKAAQAERCAGDQGKLSLTSATGRTALPTGIRYAIPRSLLPLKSNQVLIRALAEQLSWTESKSEAVTHTDHLPPMKRIFYLRTSIPSVSPCPSLRLERLI